jgi:hypothetical protein
MYADLKTLATKHLRKHLRSILAVVYTVGLWSKLG